MRHVLIALFGATAVMAQTPEDLVNSVLPSCIRSCAVDTFEMALGCDLSDTDCICRMNEGDIASDVLDSIMDDLTDCASNSDCQIHELEGLSGLDLDAVESQAQGICGGSSSSAGTSTPSSSSSASTSTSLSESFSDYSSNKNSDSGVETSDNSTPAQDTDAWSNGAMTLSGSTDILAASVMIVLAAL
ncbi:hypothetical protein BDV37DRAFT_49715 [Aspergillus pseudonomiae]|uniref:CFEM domain-containing protein n=1 Tax=Aspergillus pseudonomiae TaxID=1506151 RepID=A0A5N7CUU2_9EURO|nr:uncharacterized protein BDV37DRAFT_49715 [Aspergillus pseudonomiae]KAE8397729.1 hypothetical protein BDV37DRAFT_49715 [Aspergillus pseudonomiae]